MRLISPDRLMDFCRNQKSRSADCNDIARFPTVNAIPMSVIEDIKAEILSLKGDNFPNSYYVKIIDKHIRGKEK